MKTSRFSGSQIIAVVKQTEPGSPDGPYISLVEAVATSR